MNLDRRDHWERVYRTNDTKGVSWHQPTAGTSLDLIVSGWPDRATRILDVGGGASLLVDGLLDEGYGDIGVLDIAASALAVSKRRLGARAACVEWYVEDVRQFVSPHAWDVWHDRAVLHFLTEDRDRAMYKASLLGALALDGGAVIATFGPKGPTRCSGLDVVRYDAERLQELLGPEMDLVTSKIETHITPAGVPQQFLFGRLERVA